MDTTGMIMFTLRHKRRTSLEQIVSVRHLTDGKTACWQISVCQAVTSVRRHDSAETHFSIRSLAYSEEPLSHLRTFIINAWIRWRNRCCGDSTGIYHREKEQESGLLAQCAEVSLCCLSETWFCSMYMCLMLFWNV